jgi:putative FmdB family regulatory protein
MPMYVDQCRACGERFELLRSRNQMDAGTKCVHCGSKATGRKLSVFAPVRVAMRPGADLAAEAAEHPHDHDGADDFDEDCC